VVIDCGRRGLERLDVPDCRFVAGAYERDHQFRRRWQRKTPRWAQPARAVLDGLFRDAGDPRFASAGAKQRLAGELVRAAQATPGVEAAAICTVNPLGGGTWTAPVEIEGQEVTDRTTSIAVNHRLITPRLFEAMGIHLLLGRQLTVADGPGAPGVAIVSRRMAQKYWSGGDAIGKRVRSNRPGQPWLEVVGIVNDVNDSTDTFGPRETWYLPYSQHTETPAAADVVLMVRSILDPRGVEKAVEQSVHASNRDLALFDTAAMDGYYLDTLSRQRWGRF
jgi:MacB-like periplasmic core domain